MPSCPLSPRPRRPRLLAPAHDPGAQGQRAGGPICAACQMPLNRAPFTTFHYIYRHCRLLLPTRRPGVSSNRRKASGKDRTVKSSELWPGQRSGRAAAACGRAATLITLHPS